MQKKSLPSFLSFALGALAALTIAGPAAIQFTSAEEGLAEETTEVTQTEPCAEETPAPELTPEPTPTNTESTVESTQESTETDGTETDSTDTGETTESTECDETEEEEDTEEAENETEEADDASEESGDNHGKVVSTAAHCPVKGRAHGALVRSIAKDKDATVADAEAACEAMMAAVADGTFAQTGKPDKGAAPAKEKKSHPGKGPHGKEDDSDDLETDDADDSDDSDLLEADVELETKVGGPPPWAGGGKDK